MHSHQAYDIHETPALTGEASAAQRGEVGVSGTGSEDGEETVHTICQQTSLYTPKQKSAKQTLVLPVRIYITELR